MSSQNDRHSSDESLTTTIPISDSAVGMRVSTTTIIHDGSETTGIKICVGAGGVQGSVTMCTDKARQVRDAINKALELG